MDVSLALVATLATLQVPGSDARTAVRGVQTLWPMPQPRDRAAWEATAAGLRRRILFAAGLLPMPPRTPLNAQIFGRVERPPFTAGRVRVGGYSVEKVFFESLPGFFVTGNLYRPLPDSGRHPGVLSPHGHWAYGRLENTELASVPGRAINLARQGYVVFSYDMVGYNDAFQVPHEYVTPRAQLWGFSVLGLQLWNSIRALDFLESLPDVDPARLGATGASGGGTQTFFLAAVDDRVGVSVPVNMISAFFQGGDNCENAPGLRLDHSNVDIAALVAPRPMLMVSATGDWTRDTPRVEFRAVREIYRLLGVEERVQVAQFHALHNYNRESREAMYAFFARWLRSLSPPDTLPGPLESGFQVPAAPDLLVWYGRARPAGADVDSLLRLWTRLPVDPEALRVALAAQWPESVMSREDGDRFWLSRGSDRVEVRRWLPPGPTGASPEGAVLLAGEAPQELVDTLLNRGRVVVHVRPFVEVRDTAARYFGTYNRTATQVRVQDILTAAAFLQGEYGAVDLVGSGPGGLWALLARAVSDRFRRTVADADGFASESDSAYLARLFVPGLRRAGGFRELPGRGVLVHNAGGVFRARGRVIDARLSAAEVARALAER